MRKNYAQAGVLSNDDRIHIDNDWFFAGLPSNVELGENVYVDTSYGFTQFYSTQQEALKLGEATGCYDRASVITAEEGRIDVGKFVILNGTTLVCKNRITIGDHCMLAWGSVVTDSWLDPSILSLEARRALLKKAAADPRRRYPFFGEAKPVVLEDNCWVGFDAVILPGVRIGTGSVVACKSIIDFDVPPFAIVGGNPAKVIRYL
jgi:acetyltransferase-like isoleucine patch superfamily enzyme